MGLLRFLLFPGLTRFLFPPSGLSVICEPDGKGSISLGSGGGIPGGNVVKHQAGLPWYIL